MRTWFCKDTQRWVSEIPRAFWLGIYDYKTGEKLYSDDTIYSANPFLRSLNKDLYIKLLDLYILKNSSLNIFAVLQNNQNLSSYQEI